MEISQTALAANDVAQLLGISKNSVYGLAKRGEIGSYKVGRKLRFTIDDIEIYIARSKQTSIDSSAPYSGDATSHVTTSWTAPIAGIGHRIPRTSSDMFMLGGADATLDSLSSCLAELGMHIVRSYQNSYQSLVDLYFGYLDAAVVGLWDSSSDSNNIPYIKRLLPGMPIKVFQMASYTQGILVQKGNPLKLRSWADLLHSGAVLANREKGSAARVLLDEQLSLMEASPQTITGYDRELFSPLVQGLLISHKDADVGVGLQRVSHQISGLDYIPLQAMEVVLVVAKNPQLEHSVRILQQCINSHMLKPKLAGMVGYDFSKLGTCIYET